MSINSKKYFVLFQDCIIVKGYKRSVICDTQRNCYVYIDNDLCNYFVNSLYINIHATNHEEIHDISESLIELGYGFYDDKKPINKKPLDYYQPFTIESAIFEVNSNYTLNDIDNVIEKIICLPCLFLQIRFDSADIIPLKYILEKTKTSVLRSIEVVFPAGNNENDLIIENLIKKYNRVQILYFYNSNTNSSKQLSTQLSIIHYQENLTNVKRCGIISENYFSSAIKTFTESLHHNSCLHKKIAIDVNGNIKNCPSMSQNFGNIKDTSLEEALNHKDFKKYWNLTKDKVEVCKDCEFRYICTDCRAYTEKTHTNKEGLDTSKPLKCGYDPYTGKWEEWSKNPLKQKAIQHYNMESFMYKQTT